MTFVIFNKNRFKGLHFVFLFFFVIYNRNARCISGKLRDVLVSLARHVPAILKHKLLLSQPKDGIPS